MRLPLFAVFDVHGQKDERQNDAEHRKHGQNNEQRQRNTRRHDFFDRSIEWGTSACPWIITYLNYYAINPKLSCFAYLISFFTLTSEDDRLPLHDILAPVSKSSISFVEWNSPTFTSRPPFSVLIQIRPSHQFSCVEMKKKPLYIVKSFNNLHSKCNCKNWTTIDLIVM